MKKVGIVLVLGILVILQFVGALSLDVNSDPITNTILNSGEQPAVFEFSVRNNDDYEDFKIYTYERFKLSKERFNLAPGESETFRVEFRPFGSMKENHEHISVPVYFKNRGGSNPVIEKVSIEVVDFAKTFNLGTNTITPDSKMLKIDFYNLDNLDYEMLEVSFSAPFIDEYSESFELEPFEKKTVEIPVNSDKIKKLIFGDYVLSANVSFGKHEAFLEKPITISEKAEISKTEERSGFLIHKTIIEKTNDGNVPSTTKIQVKKGIISRLFTTYSQEPNNIKREGLEIYYIWQEELSPGETFSVRTTTNWFYPLLIIILIGVIIYLIYIYINKHLVIKKNVSFVKTKSGEFALKVRLKVKAKKFMEKVSIYDRLPAMAKLYENYGSPPSQVDKKSGRLKWDFKHLAEGEERILTYIFYSKIKIVGKFELPPATGIYEIQGQIHETQSNKSFFLNETENKKQIEENK